MLRNKYIDTSVQKGDIPEFSGCVEHTSALFQLLHEARTSHKELTVIETFPYTFVPYIVL